MFLKKWLAGWGVKDRIRRVPRSMQAAGAAENAQSVARWVARGWLEDERAGTRRTLECR